MPLSSHRLRVALRYLHLAAGAVVAALIYSPLKGVPAVFGAMAQGVLPVLIASGLVLWKLPQMLRALR
ncbi:MAG: hypothetical protein AAF761_09230 [Pseudomonadota bacterium]